MSFDPESLLNLREGSTLLGEHIIVTRGSQQPTVESVNAIYDEFERLLGEKPLVWNIHLFNPSVRPSREVRDLVIDRFSRVKSRVGFVALVTPKNLFVHVVASLIALRMRYRTYRIYHSAKDAYNYVTQLTKRHSSH